MFEFDSSNVTVHTGNYIADTCMAWARCRYYSFVRHVFTGEQLQRLCKEGGKYKIAAVHVCRIWAGFCMASSGKLP